MTTSEPSSAVDGRTAVLVLRVWTEPGDPGRPRARLIDAAEPDTTWAVAAGVDPICDEVRDWLVHLVS